METDENVVNDQEISQYQTVVVPHSMRSIYWKYFGFPGNSSNEIISRKKIICILCEAIIAYNRNTSNLRTHLVAKHPQILMEMNCHLQDKQLKNIKTNNTTYSIANERTTVKRSKQTIENDNSTIQVFKHEANENKRSRFTAEITESLGEDEYEIDDGDGGIIALVVNKGTDESNEIEILPDEPDNDVNEDKSKIHHFYLSSYKSTKPSTLSIMEDCIIDNNFDNNQNEQMKNTKKEKTDLNNEASTSTFFTVHNVCEDIETDNGYNENESTTQSIKIKNNRTDDNLNKYFVHEQIETYDHPSIVSTSNKDNYNVDILEIIIKDLLLPNLIEGNGILELLGEQRDQLQRIHLERKLKQMYDEKFIKIYEMIKTQTNQREFSLSFEIWNNIEGKILLSIYFNYYDKELTNKMEYQDDNRPFVTSPNLLSIFYKTIELQQSSASNTNEILKLFNDINMKNCVAIVFNKSHELIDEFLQMYNIPSVLCFEKIITMCLEQIFEKPYIKDILMKIYNYIEKNLDIIQDPTFLDYSEDNVWSQLNLLNFCFKIDEDFTEDLLNEIETIRSLLHPLKNTLETIIEEPIAICSLVRPFANRLLEEFFKTDENEHENISELKMLIANTIEKYISSNSFFLEACFLDPRFLYLLDTKEKEQLKYDFCKKLNQEQKVHGKVKQQINDDNLSINRRQGLKMFFKPPPKNSSNTLNNSTSNDNVKVNNFDAELIRYITEVYIDLDQCPITWWNENGYLYRHLNKISLKYFCIPACLNNIFRLNISEQIRIQNQKYLLKNRHINQLWFLYYNQDKL